MNLLLLRSFFPPGADLLLATGMMILWNSYAWIIYTAVVFWRRIPSTSLPLDYAPQTDISVVVPARNEERHILACLKSLCALHYPARLLEVILVDDFSADQTVPLAREHFGDLVRIRSLSDLMPEEKPAGSKKLALSYGIREARGALIVTTDADCTVPPNWLRHLAWARETSGGEVFAGPVRYQGGNHLLHWLQLLDNAGMMVLTGAGTSSRKGLLANGANLAFTKSLFERLKGYEGIDHLASGDDVLWVQKAARAGFFPHFVKHADAVVHTPTAPTWKAFLCQRLRWASKYAAYRSSRMLLAQALVFSMSVLLLMGLAFGLAGDPAMLSLFFGVFLAKGAVDYLLLREGCRFLGQTRALRYFWPAELLYLAYIAVAGAGGLLGLSCTWKGRQLKRPAGINTRW